MKVDGAMRSLIQGVSQQPRRSRLPGQCTAQENMSSNPVSGLTRRPPLEYIANLMNSATVPQFYEFDIGNNQRFIAAASTGSLRVFELDGSEVTVNEEDSAFDYLDGGKLAFTTLDAVTYVANTTKVVAMEAGSKSYVDTGSLVFLLGGQYSRTYSITIKWKDGMGVDQSLTVSHNSSATVAAEIATDFLADALDDLLQANGTFTGTFNCTRVSDVLYIQRDTPSAGSFTVTVSDGDGGTNMFAINNSVDDASTLPRFAPQGYIVKITGDGAADQDDWYLEFQCTPSSTGSVPANGAGFGQDGLWVENVAPGIPYLMDQETMPLKLTYDEDTGEFTIAHGDWKGRQVGDEVSNEDPSFVGKNINWLTYFQGRLVFLAGPAVIMSRTNKPDDFWIESATTSAETDPIDIESTAKGASNMLMAIPHNRDLVVFSEGAAQFIVFGRNSLTPDNSSLVLTTAFESELGAAPVPAGRNIFFAINYGAYTGIREFYTEGSQDINDSRPITQHVLKYIPGKVNNLASTSNFDMLVVQTDSDERYLYAYEYIWLGDQKAQSSWSRWATPNQIKHFFFVESVIYVISQIGEEYVLEKMDLNIQNDVELNYQVLLDRRVSVENVDTTIVQPLPDMPDIEDMVFVQGEGCPNPGLRVLVDNYDEGTATITLADDMEGGTVICGQRYMSLYTPTMPMVKDQDNVKIGTGNLIVSKFLVNYRETGYIAAQVRSPYRDTVQLSFSGYTVGNPNNLIGEAPIQDGTFVLPFRDNVENAEIDLYSDSHLPMTIMDIEYIGQYTKKGRRIAQGGNS